ncbi:GrdX protein [Tissierella sp. P1]|uniref:GrdX family protein n=1 Tax=Tissierella TaxID=41273 RepID=UPI000BA015BB|nr:GrdX family protein [Tissierella sp. P1]OZV12235.1 GrdX protein [Tissierella sp. P1]
MSSIIVTNNPYVYEKYKDKMEMLYKEDCNYIQILEFLRDKIHEGHQLLTHPLSGSIKPNETPYKTIMISKEKGSLDQQGILIVEESIETAKKFQSNKPTPDWTERVLDDFRVIDLSLIENVIDKLGHR